MEEFPPLIPRWYCNSMPDTLVDATKHFWEGRITKDEYATRIAVRRLYEARPKGRPDADGFQRSGCPASSGAPTACCELKPKTDGPALKRVRVRPKDEVKRHPPRAVPRTV